VIYDHCSNKAHPAKQSSLDIWESPASATAASLVLAILRLYVCSPFPLLLFANSGQVEQECVLEGSFVVLLVSP